MHKTQLFALVVAIALPLAVHAQELKTDDEKTLYALGYTIGQSLGQFDLSKPEFELVKKAMMDGQSGAKSKVEMDTFGPKIRTLQQTRAPKVAERQKKAGDAYAAKAAKEKGAQVTKSGMVFIPEKEGTGAKPAATDKVTVNYRGTLTDGTEFDSSYKRNEPTTFPLNQVIPCWTEGVQMIKEGGKAKLVCPAAIAYGDHPPTPKIPPGATLVFEVELIKIAHESAPPPGMPGMPNMSGHPGGQ